MTGVKRNENIKKKSTPMTKAKIIDATLWTISILGVFSALIWLILDVSSGILFLLSFLILLPPLKDLYRKFLPIRLRYIFIVFTSLWTIAFAIFCINFINSEDFQKTTQEITSTQEYRIKPQETDFESSSPIQELSYDCHLISWIVINGKPLSKTEMDNICKKQYPLQLENGHNQFKIEFMTRPASEKITETLNISFDKEGYDKKMEEEKAQRKAEAEAIAKAEAEEAFANYAEKHGIPKELAEQLLEILPRIDIATDSINNMDKLANWANGERYSFYYNGYEFLIYLNSKGGIDSINSGDIKFYNNSGITRSVNDYMLSTTEKSDLKMYSKQLVEAVLKAPSTAKFPGGFLDPYSGWSFGKEGITYKVSSYVDSQNSFGAMIRSQFYLEFNWPKDGELKVTKFTFDGEKIL